MSTHTETIGGRVFTVTVLPEARRPRDTPNDSRRVYREAPAVCPCGVTMTKLRRQCFPAGGGTYCSSACKRAARAAAVAARGCLLDEAGERISDPAYIFTGEPATPRGALHSRRPD